MDSTQIWMTLQATFREDMVSCENITFNVVEYLINVPVLAKYRTQIHTQRMQVGNNITIVHSLSFWI